MFVGRARRNTAGPLATHSESDIWGDFLWVGNLLGGSARQMQGSQLHARQAVGAISIDEISMLLRTMEGVPATPPRRAARSSPASTSTAPSRGRQGGRWAQHYTDQVVLAADLGLLVQDLV